MDPPEDALAMAERHVREGEGRVARQIAIVEQMNGDNRPEAAAAARTLLVTLETTLDLMREHLRIEREARGCMNSEQ
ncbi:hypothetical protein JMJ55_29595 [Belnapia sp. T6]|uniref:Uncharacterized protein n=1 Tax=Belnapia mucosa TaxID=2804532 RepID=A0ABS1VFE3_9PROT|nr:hypothetical protein [Belnapia mucosa]MBL6459469.1 hypothetical protein [Belnapia mucosa]